MTTKEKTLNCGHCKKVIDQSEGYNSLKDDDFVEKFNLSSTYLHAHCCDELSNLNWHSKQAETAEQKAEFILNILNVKMTSSQIIKVTAAHCPIDKGIDYFSQVFEIVADAVKKGHREKDSKYFGVVKEVANWDGKPSSVGCPKFDTKAEAWDFVKSIKQCNEEAFLTIWEYCRIDEEYAETVWQG